MADSLTEREFAYTARDFQRVRTLIHERAGISLAESKEDMVYSRLSRRLRQTGQRSFGEYLDMLEHAGEDEWQAFTNALTTNLTAFFRESHHFDALRELLQHQPAGKPLQIWSAASSTGEEPYSIAITVAEHFGRLDAPVKILATDIDTQVLATAARGVYPIDRLSKMSEERIKRYFLRGTGENAGLCRVHDSLRRMVEFRRCNLLEPVWDVKGPFSAIFCRNVMIYFDKPTQRRIIEKCMPLLTEDGLFFAGHSESFFHCADLMQAVGRTIYHRPGSRSPHASHSQRGVTS